MPNSAEPVAVVGIGCRFPGNVHSPDRFWELLRAGENTTTTAPEERWSWYGSLSPGHEGALRQVVSRGSFLSDIGDFDADFFGLSPREAELMDPQQRILLEVTWEALEHAGIPPGDLAGTDTGVYVGICTDDYGRRLLEDLPGIEAWTGIGAATCAVANRISHVLDLRGPSLAADTACSASLVALHLACQSLRFGESSLAIAGGVNLIVSPGETLSLDAAGALAPDGRCKPFDAAADGYGRGEGCGVLVVKRLRDAERDGDRVLALVLGSAVNQDGHTNGIMAPSGPAQEHVMRQACRQAGVAPETIDYVEAHGTGTRLGDPLEASALSAVYGSVRPAAEPCLIGSVKSNIGHLEGAAGVASVIKTVLALEHAEIPPSRLTTPNPEIPWDSCGLSVVTKATAWPQRDRPRRAAASGFGYGGTVAHVVLEQAPAPVTGPASAADEEGRSHLYPLSARSQGALRNHAGALADWLEGAGARAPLASVGHTLALRRSHLSHRAVVVAADRAALVTKLRQLADGTSAEGTAAGRPLPDQGEEPVWVFSGHGSHWAGMGRELLEAEPPFAAVIDELDPIFAEEIGFSPRQVLMEGDLGGVDRIQTMIFAMQVGLAEVWRSAGVEPRAVIGHSVGEIAAAVACGALSLHDGARLICRRSVLLRQVAGKGAMVMVNLPFAEVQARLAGRGDVAAAISASPESTVVSGLPAAVEDFAGECERTGIVVRKVASDVAFHSPSMDRIAGELATSVADLSPRQPRIPMYLTALEDPRSAVRLDGGYWAANLRNPVRLTGAVAAAAADGCRAFIEIAAHPVVAHSITETLSSHGIEDAFVGITLRRNQPQRDGVLAAIGAAHCHGVTADWQRLQPGAGLVALPAYSWRHGTHWREPQPHRGGGRRHDVDSHTLLGSGSAVAGTTLRTWHTTLDDSNRPYPGSHAINGVEIVPATVLVGTFMATQPGAEVMTLSDVAMKRPLMTAEQREIQVVCEGDRLRLASRAAGEEGDWLIHAAAVAAEGPASPLEEPGQLELLGRRPGAGASWEPLDLDFVARRLAAVGVPSTGFDWTVGELRRREGRLRAQVSAPAETALTWATALDAVMSVAPCAFTGNPELRMVEEIGEVTVAGEPPEAFVIDVIIDDLRNDTVHAFVSGGDGRVLARLAGLRYPVIGRTPSRPAPGRIVHELAWRQIPLSPPAERPGVVALVGPDTATLRALRDRLTADGIRCHTAHQPGDLPAPCPFPEVLLVPGDDHSPGEPVLASASLLARTAERLARSDGPGSPRLWCLTTGVLESTEESCLSQASLWGLARTVAADLPGLPVRVADLDPADPAGMITELLAQPRSEPVEDLIAARNGAVSAPRLVRPDRKPTHEPVRCRANATYLVTGGLGELGLEAAAELARRGARRIVLADSLSLPPRNSWDQAADSCPRIQGIRALEALGVTVQVVTADIADPERAAAELAPDALGLPAIRGVVHAADVLDTGPVTGTEAERLALAAAPVVDGALALHRAFPPGCLDFFAIYTPCWQLARPGHAAPSVTGAVLESLAEHRTALGATDTVALGWTPRSAGDPVPHALSAADAAAAWEFAETQGRGYFALFDAAELAASAQPLPVLAELSAADADDGPAATPGDQAPWYSALEPGDLRERVLEEVSAQIATEMKLPVVELDPRRPLVEQGLDSVMTVVIRRRLEKRFGQQLPATLLWHQPTAAAIADHLADLLTRQPDGNGNGNGNGNA